MLWFRAIDSESPLHAAHHLESHSRMNAVDTAGDVFFVAQIIADAGDRRSTNARFIVQAHFRVYLSEYARFRVHDVVNPRRSESAMHAGKQGDVVDAVIGCADAWQCFGTRDFLRLVIDMINIVLHLCTRQKLKFRLCITP
jgi:hypothetical protein